MAFSQSGGVTHYHAQLGLSDKGLAIRGLIVYYGSMKGMGLRTGLVHCCGQDDYRLKYRNTPYKHTIRQNTTIYLVY